MAQNQENRTEISAVKFNGQDFKYLRDRCLRRGQLFEDETFLPVNSSIGLQLLQKKNLSQSPKWMRPTMDSSRGPPFFILETASRFDIQQGNAGDCWVLAALGSLTQNPKYLHQILPWDQSFSQQYAGIFHFRFWQCGQWVDVVVDDRLPVWDQHDYLFIRPCKDNHEFWPCLLEKAYAKLHGSYFHLHYGYLPDALVDLTGGVVTTLKLPSSSSNLMLMVKTAAQAGSLMACNTLGQTCQDCEMDNGLVSSHAYTVTGAEQIQYRRGKEDIIRLWNPWGHTEWKGSWSDGSQEWQETSDHRKDQLYKNKQDGEFWISCQDFQKNFNCLFICNRFPISLNHENKLHGSWSKMMFENQSIVGNPADGLWSDPQYFFIVREPMKEWNVIVSFTIKPQSLPSTDKENPLNFQVVKVDSQVWNTIALSSLLGFSHLGGVCGYPAKGVGSKSKCNLTQCFHLNPGTYAVVTSTSREVQFLLRIFLKVSDIDRKLDNNLNLTRVQASLPEIGFQPSVFQRYSQQGMNIDASQLQNLLNQELLKELPGVMFSLDECRGILALMDVKVNGLLDQEEFKRLWERLVNCQHAFQNTQRSPGVLLSLDLRKAIENTDFLIGISVSRELLDLMALRYSDHTGRISFPSLVCFLMKLEVMAKAFHNLSKDGKGLYLTEMEWMNLVMYS
ncbi:PREDICTED: calpain-13 [Chrysochloris asiatica]|uniref:Calpain-13 n=1 Tax=Chrysochloris asiatica TaxID=185453 RepID=A0A9B0TB77_CHRAS|nr:PREDICTED: calpain-13 [Chrysochloris asiatica]